MVPISAGGTFTTGTSQNALLMNRQYQANDTLSANWGKHSVKFGADVIVAHTGGNSKEFGGPVYDGAFTFKPCTLSLAQCESSTYIGNIANVASYSQAYGNANYTVNDTLWAAFVQDDWKIRRDLTINLGLRYEQQTFTNSREDFAPRVGFAYNLFGKGQTVIRGGFGIYYSQIVDNSEANYALTGPTGVFTYAATPGQVGFPTSITAVPLPAFPAGAQAPLRSLYIRPGDASYYNQFFPTSTLIGYPSGLYNPVFRAVDHRRPARLRLHVGPKRRLRRLPHPAHHPAAGCRPSRALHPHRARPDPHRASCQLHAPLLDLLVRASQHDLQPGRAHQSAAPLCGNPDRL